MTRSLAFVAFVFVFVASCAGGGTTASVAPSVSPGPTSSAASPGAPASAAAIASTTPVEVPAGRILFHRVGSDGVERYFTIDADGTDELALFTREGCGCAQWSADWTRILTLDATGNGTISFMSMRPDGSDRVMPTPPIKTLNLAPGASRADGRRIAFAGWDETDPSRTGLYLASPDLADLTQVMPLADGMKAIAPFGVTPDGSQILFFGELGPEGGVTHAGSLFVVNANGSGLRQLNPPGTSYFDFAAASLSPDGRQAAFAATDSAHSAVFVADLDGGVARRITEWADSGAVWAATWSPTGEWIAYSRHYGNPQVVALVRPNGEDQKDISVARDGPDQAVRAGWSPDGEFLLVERGTYGQGDLWIMDLAGTFIGQVTHEPSSYGRYSWAPASGS